MAYLKGSFEIQSFDLVVRLNESANAGVAEVRGEASCLGGLRLSKPNPQDRSPPMAELSPLRRRMIEDMTVRNL
jgi:hypothetical protein